MSRVHAFEVALRREDVLHFLGYPDGREPAPALARLLDRAITEARRLARPRAAWRRLPIGEAPAVELDPLAAAGLVVGLVTAGRQIEELAAERLAAGDATSALLLDAAGSAAVEEAADRAGAAIVAELDGGDPLAALFAGDRASGGHVSCRISPGYGRWALSAQRAALRPAAAPGARRRARRVAADVPPQVGLLRDVDRRRRAAGGGPFGLRALRPRELPLSAGSAGVRPRFELLGGEEVVRIVDDALVVLATIGVVVENADAAELLRAARAEERGGRFFLDEAAVRGAIAVAPRRFALFDRGGAPALLYGEGTTHFAPGSAAIYRLDAASGERRPATTDDLVLLARLTDGLHGFAAQSTALVPDDVPEAIADRWRLYVALREGRKPVVTGTFRKDGFAPMRALLAAVRGGERELAERPLAVFDCCPTSPLRWSDLTAQALVDGARAGVPVQTVPVPMTGATAPVTLRDAIAQQIAEGLSGLVIAQLAQPGAAVVLGGAPSAFDMRQGAAAMGAIESALLNAAHAQVAHHLGSAGARLSGPVRRQGRRLPGRNGERLGCPARRARRHRPRLGTGAARFPADPVVRETAARP